MKKLSKFLSVLIILAVFISNIAVVSYAKTDSSDLKGYKTDIAEVVDDLRDTMTERDDYLTVKYKTKTLYNNDNWSGFINGLVSMALEETDKSDEGDYLRYVLYDYGCGYTQVEQIGDYYYYEIPFYLSYYTTAWQEEMVEDRIEDIIKSFNFTDETTQKQKCDAIYRYITSNIVYDYRNLYDESYTLKFTAYAALINGTSVCQGYATLFYRMAKECGLDVRVVAGTSRGEGHAWNMVKIGGYYYLLDTTWDAGKSMTGKNKYKYYLKGNSDFDSHTCDAYFETAEFKKNYPIAATKYTDIYDNDCSDGHNYEKYYEDYFDKKFTCRVCGDIKTESKLAKGETLAQDTDGKYYYFVDGEKKTATALVEYNGMLCFVNNGIWDKSATVLVQHKNNWYYIENGVWNNKYTNFLKSDEKIVYIKDGKWQKSKTGFVEYKGSYRYVKNGVWTKNTAIVKVDGKYYLIKNGVKISDETFQKCGNAYVKLSATKYTYNGKAQKPKISVYDSNGKTVSSKYYKVTYAKGLKNVGKYKVTVKFKGKYSGTAKLYFEIEPKGTAVSKVTAAKKSLRITVKKQSTQVTGYEIQYSTSKDFKSAKTKSVSSYKTTDVTLKDLKAKTTYYVRVRTYKKVNGKKHYSEWSSYKNKKTK